jgi:hypothetical protein
VRLLQCEIAGRILYYGGRKTFPCYARKGRACKYNRPDTDLGNPKDAKQEAVKKKKNNRVQDDLKHGARRIDKYPAFADIGFSHNTS